MRIKSDFCRAGSFILVAFALLASSSCESTPPAPAAPVQSSSVEAAPPAVAPAPVPAPVPTEAPEKPSVVAVAASPSSAEVKAISDEPDTPFAESDARPSAPAEKTVAIADAPLPAAPAMPEVEKPAPVPVDKGGEKPSVSARPTPPPQAQPAKVGTAKGSAPAAAPKSAPAPAKSAPDKKAEPPKQEQAPALAKEPVVAPVANLPDLPSRNPPAAQDEKVDFSRSVRVSAGQLLEIPYRGSGWIFLGEQNAKKGLPYDSRRLDKDGQSFMFRAEVPGTYVLKFYRQDFVNDYIVNDFVQVSVEPGAPSTVIGGFSAPVDRGRVVAEPRWPPAADASAAASTQNAAGAASPSPQSVVAQPSTAAQSAIAAQPAPAAAASAAAPQNAVVSPSLTPSPVAGLPLSSTAASGAAGTAKVQSPPAAPAVPASPVIGVPAAPVQASASGQASSPSLAAARARVGSTVKPDSGIVRESGAAPAAAVSLAPSTPPVDVASIPAATPIDEYLSIAKKEADSGRAANALAVLDKSRQTYPSGSDETWWLYGRLLEANSPAKDVKAAIAYYRRLVAEYPQSARYDEAQKRIAYLERYYFEIR